MNTPPSRYLLSACLAILVMTPFGLRAQTDDCTRGVVVQSPAPELQLELRSVLTAHGLRVVTDADNSECGTFTLRISGDSTTQYEITLQDNEGHTSLRTLHDLETVVTLVESWARPNAVDSLGLMFPEFELEPIAETVPEVVATVSETAPEVVVAVPETVTETPQAVVPETVAETSPAVVAPPEVVVALEPEITPEPAATDELPMATLLLPPRRNSPLPSFSAAFVQSGAQLSQAGPRVMGCLGAGRFCGGYDATFAAGPSASPATSPALTAWLHADVAVVTSFRHTLMFTGVGLGARWMSGSAVFSRLPDDQQRTIVDSTGGASDDGAGAGTDPVIPDDNGDDGTGADTDPVIPDDNGEEEEAEEETEFEKEAEQKAVGDDLASGRVADSFSLSTQLFVHFDIPLNDRIALTPGAAFLIAPLSSSIEAYRPPGLDWSVLFWVGVRPGRHR